jgi:hypothetical protein
VRKTENCCWATANKLLLLDLPWTVNCASICSQSINKSEWKKTDIKRRETELIFSCQIFLAVFCSFHGLVPCHIQSVLMYTRNNTSRIMFLECQKSGLEFHITLSRLLSYTAATVSVGPRDTGCLPLVSFPPLPCYCRWEGPP